MENIDLLKHSVNGYPKYILRNANVYVSQNGFHYTKHLDPVENLLPEIDETKLSDKEISYIEVLLQSNSERFINQVNIVKKYLNVKKSQFLDIGCGGGEFLSKLRDEGTTTIGIELSDSRACYAKTMHSLEIIKRPIEDDYWEKYVGRLDGLSLWDVIEHVNYPLKTMKASAKLLKKRWFFIR